MVALASMAHFISNSRVWNDWSFLQEKAGLLILAKATDDWPLMVSRRSFTSLLYRIESKVAKTSVVPEISRSSPLDRLLRLHLPFGEKAWCSDRESNPYSRRQLPFGGFYHQRSVLGIAALNIFTLFLPFSSCATLSSSRKNNKSVLPNCLKKICQVLLRN